MRISPTSIILVFACIALAVPVAKSLASSALGPRIKIVGDDEVFLGVHGGPATRIRDCQIRFFAPSPYPGGMIVREICPQGSRVNPGNGLERGTS